MSEQNCIGSVWNRWDLHIHSPDTALNDQFAGSDAGNKWGAYLDKIESYPEVKAIAITDYYSFDNYRKFKNFHDQGRANDIEFHLPNLELRLDIQTEDGNPVNFHILVNPDILEDFERVFFPSMKFGEYFCTRNDLIKLGQQASSSELSENEAYELGISQFKVSYTRLMDFFNDNPKIRKNVLLGIPNNSKDGLGGLSAGSFQSLRDFLYGFVDFIDSGRPKDVEYFLGLSEDKDEEYIKQRYGKLLPCIKGSDAHNLEKVFCPHKDRKCWIKSELTFEGLKQIKYEPQYRVHIGQYAPQTPIHVINKLTLSNPELSVESKAGQIESTYPFCFNGVGLISFSPSYTCVVGGRGSGKSTLLQLINAGMGKPAGFLDGCVLHDDNGQVFSPSDFCSLNDGTPPDSAEYLPQDKVEGYAINGRELSSAIYNRITQLDSSNKLMGIINEAEANGDTIDSLVGSMRKYASLIKERANVEKRIGSLERIVSSLNDPAHKEINDKISELAGTLSEYKSDIAIIENAESILAEAIHSLESIKKPKDEDAKEWLDGVIVQYGEIRKSSPTTRILADLQKKSLSVEADIATEREKLEVFLAEKGVEPQNALDLNKANEDILELKQSLANINEEISEHKEYIDNNPPPDQLLSSYMEHSIPIIDDLNDLLKATSPHVKSIVIKPGLLFGYAHSSLASELIDLMNQQYEESNLRADKVRRCIEQLNGKIWAEGSDDDVFDALFDGIPEGKTVNLLKEYLRDSNNIQILRLMYMKRLCSIKSIRSVNIEYGDKPIETCSFGQRCTAVLVILLSIGNHPLIIDEPEAHLDSALIAEYLTDLIKRQKSRRQIIFATHNANFVINGDADLVISLNSLENGITNVQQFAIENIENRESLLKLEGGKEAFAQRGWRYSSKPDGDKMEFD